jgi:hypothetical protein
MVIYSELLAAIAGSIYYFKYKHTVLKYFLFLLWYITITELISWYGSVNDVFGFYKDGLLYRTWLYNLLRIVTFSSLFYIYFKYLKNDLFKKWIKLFAFVYIIITILNWILWQHFLFERSETPRIIGTIFLIITIIFYFIELLRSDKIVIFYRMLLFWISVGLLLYYSGTLPFVLKWNGYMLLPGIHKLFLIVYILAIIMYLTFTFGFIWSKKESH